MPYVAPVRALQFAMEHIAAPESGPDPLSAEDIAGVLDEAARFAERELAPLNAPGDRIGARRHADGAVSTAPGFRDAYRAWAEAGWNGVTLPADWGGMGLSTAMGVAAMEMWTSACMAFGVGVLLTHGAVELLVQHASPELQALYLPRLVSGEWSATMALTEPQAGSDLGALRTRAVRQDDGAYRIHGDKIFITFGEHDLTENIVHLVLARVEGAPVGTRGLSLFLVPKHLPDADGRPGARNEVLCTGIEHKMGLHASPTCSLSFGGGDGALGWLVGEENQGLAAMFIMMNRARLGTGMQGVAIAERATQRAEAFARTRIQGRVPTGERDLPIIHHPDVRRMLQTMKALTAAGRALGYAAASAIETGAVGATPEDRRRGQAQAALLTPLVKAFCSELGFEAASLGVQVHGGMGYVEETGAAQYFRDARITPIYEGANGIQAIDLTLRKVRKLSAPVRPDGGRRIQPMDGSETPWLPWSKQVFDERAAAEEAGTPLFDPTAACLPSGNPRLIASPYPIEIIQTPTTIYLLHETHHMIRTIHMDRPLPDPATVQPTYMGYSVGHWEGDVLVVRTRRFNDQIRLDAAGTPQSADSQITERFRVLDDGARLENIVTVEDPANYASAWSTRLVYDRSDQTALKEDVCAYKLLHPNLRERINAGPAGAPAS